MACPVWEEGLVERLSGCEMGTFETVACAIEFLDGGGSSAASGSPRPLEDVVEGWTFRFTEDSEDRSRMGPT